MSVEPLFETCENHVSAPGAWQLTWSKMRKSQGAAGVKGPTRPNVFQMGSVLPTCRRTCW